MNSSISQEEIEALFGGAPGKTDENAPLAADEMDALGEVGNICMGNAATTLGEILGRRVRITTPRVRVLNLKDLAAQYKMPFVVVEVRYTEGLEGNNVLILKKEDVLLITDLMVGGEGKAVEDGELGELQLSAISETMNQMMGSSATSMSDMLGKAINISPPRCTAALMGEEKILEIFPDTGDIIQVSFSLEIEGVANSEFMQLMPIWFGRKLTNALLNKGAPAAEGEGAEAPPEEPGKAPEEAQPGPEGQQQEEAEPAPEAPPTPAAQAPEEPPATEAPAEAPAAEAPAPAEKAFVPPPAAAPARAREETYAPPAQPRQQVVSARPIRYASFDDEEGDAGAGGESIGLIIDVPMQVSIELGKCRKTVKEILEFNVGTILVLEKLAGEPVEIVVNEKLIARGEVMQIDDNYGVRITEILSKAGKAG